MKENNNYIKEKYDKVIEKANEILTGKNALFILLVYVIGTIIVMIRNFDEGIPFATYSIVNYAILTLYLVIFAGVSLYEKLVIRKILENEYDGGKIKKYLKKFGSCLGIILVISITMIFLMNMFLYETDINKIIAYVILLYVFLPLLGNSNITKNISNFTVLMILIIGSALMMDVPASIGGLKAISVKFYNYQNEIVYDYLYYGEYSGNYIFKETEDKIILRSIDSGYIEYYKIKKR